MCEMKTEFDLFAQRKAEDESPLRLWFYSELLTQFFMRKLKVFLETNRTDNDTDWDIDRTTSFIGKCLYV